MPKNPPLYRFSPGQACFGTGLSLCLVVLGSGQVSAQKQKFILMAPSAPVAAVNGPAPSPHARSKSVRLPPKQVPAEKFVLPTDLLFEPSKDRLTEAGEASLRALVPSLKALGAHPMEIVAHSDSLGFESYNQEFTQRLAQRVKDWFVVHGLAKGVAISARGVGSSQPVAVEIGAGGKDSTGGRARNRRIEICIDRSKDVEPEKVATKVEPSKDSNDMTHMALPPEMQEGLLDPTMRPCSEEDLAPEFTPSGGEQKVEHKTNTAEWGTGGTNFGNSVNSFGSPETFGGNPVEYNAEGKKVVKITPTAEKQEQQRKDTVEAQNEFGLWRGP
jgi:outer membrane protein OmpA-like peptidoglycan-associated protein